MALFRSVFVKIYVQMALLFVAGFFLLLVTVDSQLERLDKEMFLRFGGAQAEVIVHRLEAVEPGVWPAILENFSMGWALDVVGVEDTLTGEWERLEDNTELLFSEGYEDAWMLALRFGAEGQYLVLQEGLTEPTFSENFADFGPIAILLLVLIFGVYRITRQIERPVNTIATGTLALAQGELSTRLQSEEFEQPFRTLGEHFNVMAEKIQRLIRDQQIIVGAIPHELRTPLSRVRFSLDLARSATSLEELRSKIEIVDYNVDILESIVSDTLALSRLELSGSLNYAKLDMGLILKKLVAEKAAYSEVTFSVHVDPLMPRELSGHEALLRRAIGNLLDNAERFAVAEVHVELGVQQDGQACLTVHDDGAGVALQYHDRLFVPFSRIDDSRDRATGGVGLGLALIDLILRKHGGVALYSNSRLGGAAFSIEWPAVENSMHVT